VRADDRSAGGSSRVALLLLVAGLAVVAVMATLGILRAAGAFTSQETRQEEVAERGAEVMPFDLEKTTHVFEPTSTGGVQQVVADDPSDGEQIALIQAHLREEAEAFRRGDLADPAEIHGQDMPGLEKLEAGATKIDIRYSELPDGAQIKYETDDPALVSALHEWFYAQLSDHGGHAEGGGAGSSEGRSLHGPLAGRSRNFAGTKFSEIRAQGMAAVFWVPLRPRPGKGRLAPGSHPY
jgi:hypothetical protein